MSKNKEFWIAVVLSVFCIALLISPKYWQERRWASANVTVVDNNYHVIPYAMVGFKSLEESGYEMKSVVVNGNAIVGCVRKGEYEVRVWFGDLDRVEQLLYSGKTKLEKQGQDVFIQLNNITQRILILVAEPNTTIPVSPAGESIKIEAYRK